MRHPQVHWHEGLFLRPHHFQAADRHWQEMVHANHCWDHPNYWGLLNIEYGRDALAAGQLEVRRVRARMRDGTLIDRGDAAPLDRVDLAPAFAVASSVTAYLAVPRLAIGERNVDLLGEPGRLSRFRESRRTLQDDADGGNDQEVSFRELDVRIKLSTDELSGFETLPIARLHRSGENTAAPELDVSYIPPAIAMRAWAPLNELFRDICDVITRKRDVLASQVAATGLGFELSGGGDMQRVLMFITLNQLLGGLAALATSRHIHPFEAYAELCRCVGALAAFDPRISQDSVPTYDHDDLGQTFAKLRRRIESAISAVRDHPYQQRYFEGVGSRMQVTLDADWFHADWQWLVGVRKGELTDDEVIELLSPGKLDWKLGSGPQVEMLFSQRLPGLQLRPTSHKLPALPSQQDWIYFEVPHDDGPAWRSVQDSQTLAIRFRDSLLRNRDHLAGTRRFLVDRDGETVELQLALFATRR